MMSFNIKIILLIQTTFL